MGKSFSLSYGEGLLINPMAATNREEYFFEYLSEFDPFQGMEARVAVQKMISGRNFQDSGVFYSDGTIVVAGRLMKVEEFDQVWGKYTAADRRPFVFTSYLRGTPGDLSRAESWKVCFKNFKPSPERIIKKTDFRWSLELYVIGKWVGGKWVA